MATWNDLPMELRLIIFKVKIQLYFIERKKDKLIELLKRRIVKIVETLNCTFTFRLNDVERRIAVADSVYASYYS